MGMFDSVKCNWPLPAPLEIINWLPDLYDLEFQTKDLDNLLDTYTIDEDGALWVTEKTYKWVDDDSAFLKGYNEVVGERIKKEPFHGMLNFYAYERVYNDEKQESGFDVSIDYLGKFIDGKLEKVDVLDYSINDATEHILDLKNFYIECDERNNKIYNKYFFNTKPVNYIRRLIRLFFYKLHNFTGKLTMFVNRYV
jgi:hypothetical protein